MVRNDNPQELLLPPSVSSWLSAPYRISPLAQGTANQLYQIETRDDTLVWRVFSKFPAPGVDRSREQRIMTRLQGRSWIPKVLLWHDEGMLMPRYELKGAVPDDLTASDRQALLQILIELWRTPVHEQAYDYPALIRQYAQQAPDSGALREVTERLLAGFRHWPHAVPRLLHSDLHPGNVWRSDGKWLLLDWEYAAPGNPWIDAVSIDRWLPLTELEKAQLWPWLAPWAVSGDAWAHYRQWLQNLDTLWSAAHKAQSDLPQGTS